MKMPLKVAEAMLRLVQDANSNAEDAALLALESAILAYGAAERDGALREAAKVADEVEAGGTFAIREAIGALLSAPEPAPESLPCPVCDDGIDDPCPRCCRPSPRTTEDR